MMEGGFHDSRSCADEHTDSWTYGENEEKMSRVLITWNHGVLYHLQVASRCCNWPTFVTRDVD